MCRTLIVENYFLSSSVKTTVTHQKPNIPHRFCGYFKKIFTFDVQSEMIDKLLIIKSIKIKKLCQKDS